MNNYSCSGNIGNEVKLEYTKDGKPIMRLNIAIKVLDKTLWLRSTVFGQSAEFLSKYASKGSKLAMVGELTPNDYKNKDGVEIKSIDFLVHRVELLDKPQEHREEPKPVPTQKPKVDISAVVKDDMPLLDISSDDLPF